MCHIICDNYLDIELDFIYISMLLSTGVNNGRVHSVQCAKLRKTLAVCEYNYLAIELDVTYFFKETHIFQ